MEDEQTAIKRMRAGDISGLATLVQQHQVEAIRAVYLITHDRELAEDIVQAAFVRVYERIRQFDTSRPFRAWFLKSVIHDAVKAVTRQRRHQPLENSETGEQWIAIPTPVNDPAHLLEIAQTREEVWKILTELPPEQRAAIVMRYYLDFSQAEIAQKMDVPLGTVTGDYTLPVAIYAPFLPHFGRHLMQRKDRKMDNQSIRKFLQNIAEAAIPDHTNLWPRIERQITAIHLPSRWPRLKTKRSWAIGMILALLSVSLVAYAIDNILQRAIEMDPGLNQVNVAEMGTELDLAQTVDEFTVTLEWAYADGNRIAVGYTISSPALGQLVGVQSAEPMLSDRTGRVFTSFTGLGAGVENNVGGYVETFDASMIDDAPETLELHLEMGIMAFEAIDNPTIEPTLTADEQALVTPEDTVAEAEPVQIDLMVGPIGPFVFDFTVPFYPAQIYDVAQIESVGENRVTLESVRVAPSMATAKFCFPPPDTQYTVWTPIVSLETANGDIADYLASLDEAGCGLVSFVPPLEDIAAIDNWVFTVTELVGFREVEPYDQTRIDGPWVFMFDPE